MGGVTQDDLLRLLFLAPLFLFSLTVHELAHAWMAKRWGDDTAEREGRLTMDPRVHIDPLGALFFAFSALAGYGFGWAKPVPVVLSNTREPLKAMFWIALAGPVSNVLQALVAVALLVLLGFAGAQPMPYAFEGINAIVGGGGLGMLDLLVCLLGAYLWINVALAIFNLLPLPPLDGGRIVVSLARPRMSRFFASLEPYGFMILLLLSFVGFLNLWVVYPLVASLRGVAWLFQALGLG